MNVARVTAITIALAMLLLPLPGRGESVVRKPAVAGTFYPGTPEDLESFVSDALSRSPKVPVSGERIVGIVVPHAGYVYSGRTAGAAYGFVRGVKYDTVILLGPSHFTRLGKAAIFKRGCFETPLGRVKVDEEVAGRIIEGCPACFDMAPSHFAREHSLEVQVPFLQVALNGVKIIPIEVNTLDVGFLRRVAKAIAGAISGKRVLIVASSDLSHYHPRARARALDGRFREALEAFDPFRLAADLLSGTCEACGGAAVILALMSTAEVGGDRVYVVDYADSGDATGDKSSVVGYLSALILKGGGKTVKERRVKMSEYNLKGKRYLTDEERRELLKIARDTLEEYLSHGRMPTVKVAHPSIEREGAAFVTLEKGGKLRGCIGYTEARYPLYKTVMECAVAAATEDPRFPPVEPGELDEVDIEISVLTPLTKVEDIEKIEVGRHGLMVVKGFRKGLLLPQVPVEYGWDRDTFLSQTCLKAGLPRDEWKRGVNIYSFEAEVFGENDYRE